MAHTEKYILSKEQKQKKILLHIKQKQIKDLLRSNVSLGAQHSSGNMSTGFIRSEFGQSKVRNFGMEILVQKNVAAFKISVYDRGIDVLMEIFQTFCCLQSYLQPGLPVQLQTYTGGPYTTILKKSYRLYKNLMQICFVSNTRTCLT